LPQALEDLGGWQNREAVKWFADYAALIATRYGDRVKRFATFNEPSIFNLFNRSLRKRDRSSSEDALYRATHHVNLAHGAAVDVLREKVSGASIGCIQIQPCWPSSASEAGRGGAPRSLLEQRLPHVQCRGSIRGDAACDRAAGPGDLERICRPVDWFGLNHYSPVYTKADPTAMLGYDFGDKPAGVPLTPIGWPINPDAFSETLRLVHDSYRLPIYVLENGLGNFDRPNETGAVSIRTGSHFCAAISGR
jgi:beta-glucosidase